MKHSGSTGDRCLPAAPLHQRRDDRRQYGIETRRWLDTRNAEVGSKWVGGNWARTPATTDSAPKS